MLVTVMYPAGNGATFDEKYYMATHMPLVRERWRDMGLTDTKVMRGIPGPDGAAPTCLMTAVFTFRSMDDFKAAAAKHGEEIFADIPHFTQSEPALQFHDPVA